MKKYFVKSVFFITVLLIIFQIFLVLISALTFRWTYSKIVTGLLFIVLQTTVLISLKGKLDPEKTHGLYELMIYLWMIVVISIPVERLFSGTANLPRSFLMSIILGVLSYRVTTNSTAEDTILKWLRIYLAGFVLNTLIVYSPLYFWEEVSYGLLLLLEIIPFYMISKIERIDYSEDSSQNQMERDQPTYIKQS